MAWIKDFVYFGTSGFSQKILAGLLAQDIRPLLVVSTSSKPSGRGLSLKDTPVSQLAKQSGLNLVTVKSLRKGLPDELLKVKADFGLLAAFGRILPVELLNLFSLGIVNVHPSLLPLYRGASPIQSALMAGELETGVSLIKLDEEVDHGPILAQQKIVIDNKNTSPELEKILANTTIEMLAKIIPEYLAGQAQLKEQVHEQATFTKLISKSDGQADFNLPAINLNNKRRAFTPWPGLWTTWQGRIIKLIDTEVAQGVDIKPGQLVLDKGSLMIGCSEQSALIIKTLQLEGGKVQTGQSFLNGHPTILQNSLPS